jgi:TetR/AcrR family transcriptional regulator, tetracycline repressor protein
MSHASRPASADDTAALWFSPPASEGTRRPQLTQERLVSEALALIVANGCAAFSMRALATQLGVVPGALYRHVRSKEQLYDLVLDGVLAEVDTAADPALGWPAQIIFLAQRLRSALEQHPGIAEMLKARNPVSPHALAMTEAFLAALQASGLAGRQTARAYRLIYDYTVGFALSDPTSPGQRLIQDSATRRELHAFLRSLPPDRFPLTAALGEHVWAADCDEQFTAGLATLIAGLQGTTGAAPARSRRARGT